MTSYLLIALHDNGRSEAFEVPNPNVCEHCSAVLIPEHQPQMCRDCDFRSHEDCDHTYAEQQSKLQPTVEGYDRSVRSDRKDGQTYRGQFRTYKVAGFTIDVQATPKDP